MLIDTIVTWLKRRPSTQEISVNPSLNYIHCQVNGQKIPFYYRHTSPGDCGVIEQIFKNEDYRVDIWPQGKALIEYYQTKIKKKQLALIIDAGANIGASAVYFASQYSQSFIFAIEPEKNNHELLKLNTEKLNVETFEGAISCEDGEMYLQDPGLSDWGFRVVDHGTTKVPTISPKTILQNLSNNTLLFPFIFKIDIEGGEEKLFQNNLEWMNLFPLIVIELHDWMLPFQGSSHNFIKAIAEREFDILYIGENIFCFNKQLLHD